MKAQLLKRIQALEQAALRQSRRPIVMVEVLAMTDADREAYWAGDRDVLRKYGAPDPAECPVGQIHTIVIDVHPDSRQACREMTDPKADDIPPD